MPRLNTENRRETIAIAALQIVARDGIAELTLGSLASELDLTAGALYRHFKSREEILGVAAEYAARLITQDLPQHAPPMIRLEEFVRARAGTAQSHAGAIHLALSDQFAKALPVEARDVLKDAVGTNRLFLVSVVRDGLAEGRIRDDIPLDALVTVIMGTVQLLALRSTGWAGGLDASELDESILALRRLLAAPSA